jgi:hypothetical protein
MKVLDAEGGRDLLVSLQIHKNSLIEWSMPFTITGTANNPVGVGTAHPTVF